MRALSLTQPWATAVAISLKQWETRSWTTSFRGEVAIHASKGFPGWAKDFARSECTLGRLPKSLPLGAIICLAEITDCRATYPLSQDLSAIERMYGDYAEGRYAFKIENVRPLKTPVAERGSLGFWAVGIETQAAIREALRG